MAEFSKSQEPFLKVAERCLPINEIVNGLDLFYQNAPGPKNAHHIVDYFMKQLKEVDYNFEHSLYQPKDSSYINMPEEQFLAIQTFKDFCEYLQTRINQIYDPGQTIYEVYCSRK